MEIGIQALPISERLAKCQPVGACTPSEMNPESFKTVTISQLSYMFVISVQKFMGSE